MQLEAGAQGGEAARLQLQNTQQGQRAVSDAVTTSTNEPRGTHQPAPQVLKVTEQDSLALAGTLLSSVPGWGAGIRGPKLSSSLKRTTKNYVTFKERTPKSWQKQNKTLKG